jgi:hypothetical protein
MGTVKQVEHEILHRNQHSYLVAEVFLEGLAAHSQTRTSA